MENPSKKLSLNAIARLKESYLHWNRMAESYEHPEEFRIYLNACIQSLRNVTFVLQKQKSEISNFDQWYESWQNALKADPIMAWCVSARNKIVKEGDLKTHSIARASYVASYLESPQNDFVVDPFMPTDKIALQIANTKLPEKLKHEGFLRVERRWIAEDLQSYELLEALAYTFAVLAQLVMDADSQKGPSFSTKAEPGENYIDVGFKTLGIDHTLLPPCMSTFADYRTVWIKLSTMDVHHLTSRIVKYKKIPKKTIIERYGELDLPTEAIEGKSKIEKMAIYFLEQAKKMLEVDGQLYPMASMLDGKNRLFVIPLEFPSHEDKYQIWHKLAEEVKKFNVEIVFTVAEAWMSKFDPKHPKRRAEESPDRLEAIQLDVISKNQGDFSFCVPFSREDNHIKYSDNLPIDTVSSNFLMPIKRIWKSREQEKSKLHDRLSLESNEPSRKQPCLCGSGKKFKNCCGNLYKTDERKFAFEKYNEGKYKEALKACRLEVTWYILCHRAHTIPFLRSGTDETKKLLEVDIDALSSLLELLIKCYEKTGKEKEITHLVDSLKNAISDQRWYDRIRFYHNKAKTDH